MKSSKRGISSCTNSRLGAQKPSPATKIIAMGKEKSPTMVNDELIMPFLSPSRGKYRTKPKSIPSLENTPTKLAAEISAVAKPTSAEG